MTSIIRTIIFIGKDRFNISDIGFFSVAILIISDGNWWWFIPVCFTHGALIFVFAVARVTKIGKEILKETTND
jgi:hypothetical protein